MSTQSRSPDNNYDPNFRNPGTGPSGNPSSGHHRPFNGGRGRGRGRGRGGPGFNSHNAPVNSANFSYKKVNNAQAGQSRSNPEIVNASHSIATSGARSVQNGDHIQPALQGVSSTPTPAAATKPANVLPQKTSQPLPRAPSSSTNSDFNKPSTPAKGGGDKGFTLQFGSISPGFGMQVPARTSSAPPNLHEQTHDQAGLSAPRSVPAVPLPIGLEQDLTKTDVALVKKPVTMETKPETQAKRDIIVASASPPTQGQKPSALPIARISMPLPFQQPTPSMQFGGPNPQIHSQGVPTSQLQMPMQMGNPSQVPQQFFYPGLPHSLIQNQRIMHQGPNVGYNPQLATQLPPHLQNIGNNMSSQYDQQPTAKFSSPRKSVKITHPDTHEELTLDAKDGGPSGSMSHHSVPAPNHPLPTFTANQPMGYYSNSYTTSPPFYPAPSLHPLTSEQLNATTQRPMFNHQTQSNISIKKLPSNTLPVKIRVSKLGNADSTSADHPRNVPKMVPQVPPSSTFVTIKTAGDKAASMHDLGNAPESGARKRDVEVSLQSETGVGRLNQSKPASGLAVTSSPAPSPAVLSMNPSNLTSIPCHVDAVSKVTSVTPISMGDSQTQLTNKADGKNDSKILKDLVDSSKSATSDMSEAKMTLTSSGLRDGIAETIRSSPTLTDSAPTDASVNEISANPSRSSKSATSDMSEAQMTLASSGLGDGVADTIRSSPNITDSAPTDASANEISANPSLSCKSCESQIHKYGTQSGLPKCNDITRKSSVTEDKGEQECQEVLLPGNSPKGSYGHKGADPIHQGKLTEKADLVSCSMEASQRDADPASSATKEENMQHTFHDVSANILEVDAVDAAKIMDHPRPNSSSGIISGELNKTKHKGKKKLKELLQKADALGTTTDLYMAYKGPEDKKGSSVASEHAAEENVKEVDVDANIEKSTRVNQDEQDQVELDDWEDADDISIPKLELSGKGADNDDATTKKYSRDFLLTFSEYCTDLPRGFEITSDVGDALMCVSVRTPRSDREYVSPRTVVDRSGGVSKLDRRGSGVMDTDRWNKQPGPSLLSQDPRMDLAYGSNVLGSQGGRGATYGVLRHPPPQGSVQHAGGILSGPIHSSTFQGFQRNNSDNWRSTNFNKGIIPSPHTPAPVIHKAEKKYEVGKITDEEQAKQRTLKGILNKLTPQNFQRLFEQVKEVNIDNVITLTGVISQIFDKALTELTFCEMYANFCQHLASELPDLSVDNEKITFRRLLLNKCQEEFERGEREEQEANNVNGEGDTEQSEAVREEKKVKARRRMLGNIRLIGELYKKRMLTERIMHECIKKLLGQYQNPDEENIEALCKLMSTIGEMIDHPKAKDHMDAYFKIMGQLSNNMQLSSRVRFMLKDAIDLRKNKWQQRRKVEGPKKIEDVHRDAAQERLEQVSRLNRGPSMNSSMRRGHPLDFGPRGSMLSSPIGPGMGFRGLPQVHGFGGQDMRMDERNISMPYARKLSSEVPITLGPQGGLARGMAVRGQPSVSYSPMFDNSPSFEDPGRVAGGLNGYGTALERGAHITREDHFIGNASNKLGASAFGQSSRQEPHPSYTRFTDRNLGSSRPTTPPAPVAGAAVPQNNSTENTRHEKQLRDKTLETIKEYYSAKDEKEVALCIKDLNSPSFNSAIVSIWVSDSFERKDIERDSLAKLLVALTKSHDGTFSGTQLITGFESVLTDLEDTVTDAPKAPEFLGRILAKIVLENVLTLRDVGRLIQKGGEEPGRLVEAGLAAEVIGSLLEMIQSEKGESTLKDIRASCNLQLEDFRPPHPIRCRKLDMFM